MKRIGIPEILMIIGLLSIFGSLYVLGWQAEMMSNLGIILLVAGLVLLLMAALMRKMFRFQH
jgi:hypothetical protein